MKRNPERLSLRARSHEFFHDYYYGHARRRALRLSLIAAGIAIVLIAVAVVVLLVRHSSPGSPAALSVTESGDNADTAPATGPSTLRPFTSEASSPPAPTAAETTVVLDSAMPATTDISAPASTLPDGQPVPIVAIFEGEKLTLRGTLPSRSAIDRLEYIMVGLHDKPVTLNEKVSINPSVSTGVGVRILDLNSVGFSPGSAIIDPKYARDLDTISTVMRGLPNSSVVAIGHTDQVGTELADFGLADQRAQAAVDYLIVAGIDPARLATRSAGLADLEASGDDAIANKLTAKSEFIVYGLFVGR